MSAVVPAGNGRAPPWSRSQGSTPAGSSLNGLTATPMQTPPFSRGKPLPEGLLNAVFLLPNVAESAEFMQAVFTTFSEDNIDAPELSRVAVRQDDDVAQVALQHLGPVDALEDVQRLARRVTGRQPPSSRRSALRPRFEQVHELPKVEDAVAASSTMVLYFLRPFISTKDAERQLGPIGIIEASYRGSSHSFVPARMVIALEEPSELNP